ncbi:hypothetical protein J6590_078504, partial [Homalodisca vitripennis]
SCLIESGLVSGAQKFPLQGRRDQVPNQFGPGNYNTSLTFCTYSSPTLKATCWAGVVNFRHRNHFRTVQSPSLKATCKARGVNFRHRNHFRSVPSPTLKATCWAGVVNSKIKNHESAVDELFKQLSVFDNRNHVADEILLDIDRGFFLGQANSNHSGWMLSQSCYLCLLLDLLSEPGHYLGIDKDNEAMCILLKTLCRYPLPVRNTKEATDNNTSNKPDDLIMPLFTEQFFRQGVPQLAALGKGPALLGKDKNSSYARSSGKRKKPSCTRDIPKPYAVVSLTHPNKYMEGERK